MEAIATSILIVVAMAMSIILGKWLPIVLPQKSHLLDRKPFNCRPCTTFHLTWVSIGLVAIFLGMLWLSIVGVAVAFIVFFIIQKNDNNKIIE